MLTKSRITPPLGTLVWSAYPSISRSIAGRWICHAEVPGKRFSSSMREGATAAADAPLPLPARGRGHEPSEHRDQPRGPRGADDGASKLPSGSAVAPRETARHGDTGEGHGGADPHRPGAVLEAHVVGARVELDAAQKIICAQDLRGRAVDPRAPARIVGLRDDEDPGPRQLDIDVEPRGRWRALRARVSRAGRPAGQGSGVREGPRGWPPCGDRSPARRADRAPPPASPRRSPRTSPTRDRVGPGCAAPSANRGRGCRCPSSGPSR